MHATDIELVRGLAAGDDGAFQALIGRFANDLFGLAYSLVGNAADAEDVVQQTLVVVVNRIGSFEGRSSLKTWLFRIVMNLSSKSLRSRRVRRAMSLNDPDQPAAQSIADRRTGAAAVDARMDVMAALDTLSSEHREVLVLRELQGMSYDEIAEALKVPRGTVESRLFRARRELRAKLE